MLAVLKGGNSDEKAVSLVTAENYAASISRQNIPFQEVDASDPDWIEQIKKLHPEIVLIALHGPFEKEGLVQKILEDLKIPHTGSSSTARTLTINKRLSKRKAKEINIAVPELYSLETIAYPAIIKPNISGSSFGVSIVQNSSELNLAIESAKKYDKDGDYIIEEFIDGDELTCGVIDVYGSVTALPLVKIIPDDQIFSYRSKYSPDSKTEKICPAGIDAILTRRIQEESVKIFREYGLKQYARVDWILRDQIPFFLEVNTLPGMRAPGSLMAMELKAANVDYDDFVKHLVLKAN